MYSADRAIRNTFPPSQQYPGQVDVSVRQLLATLPYFRGGSYSERLVITSGGKAQSGSLKQHYFKRTGSSTSPERYTFANNGFGHTVIVTRGSLNEAADYHILIRDLATGAELMNVYAVFSPSFQGVAAPDNRHQWFLVPRTVHPVPSRPAPAPVAAPAPARPVAVPQPPAPPAVSLPPSTAPAVPIASPAQPMIKVAPQVVY